MVDEASYPADGALEQVRVVFMGTPDFAVPTLERLMATSHVVAVYTQPDRPAGRGRTPRPSPVKLVAQVHEVPVVQPTSLRRDPDAVAALRELAPDVVVVAAYGLFLPTDVLEMAPGGAVNVHASLLPRWRGASPVSHAMLAGDERTGATIMLMDEGWDTGPMLAQRATAIGETETAGEVTDRLSQLGADLLVETLPAWLAGDVAPSPQDDSMATLAPRLSRADGSLDWQRTALELARHVRALHPWPGAYTTLPNGDRLKVHGATAVSRAQPSDAGVSATSDLGTDVPVSSTEEPPDQPPGTVLGHRDAMLVATGGGLLRLDEVQAAGRRRVSGSDFVRGRPDVVGAALIDAELSE